MFLPFVLSGTFGEIRSGHFHSGTDIRTNEKEGEVVMAVADGYVSRIKISATGFGKALYITHPNGYTSVYGHLQRFNETIAAFADSVQYAKESFEMDVMPGKNTLPVRAGQLIAFSGNTGGSEGPHLHFEIRDKETEHPINPLLFGYKILDTIAPVIQNLKIYQLHATEFGLITDTAYTLSVSDKETVAASLKSDTVLIYEATAFSADAFDLMNGSENLLGLTTMQLKVDDKTMYTWKFNDFAFEETKYANANIDYAEKINNNKTYALLYRLPANNFSMFGKDTLMKGLVNIADTLPHSVEITVTDFSGNATSKKIVLKKRLLKRTTGSARPTLAPKPKTGVTSATLAPAPGLSFISYKKAPAIKQADITVSFPSVPAVYNYAPFSVKREEKLKQTYSPLFSVGDKTTPLHTFMLLSLKPSNLAAALQPKALIVSVDDYGNQRAEESSFTNGWVTGKIKHFGKFTVAIDTVAPTITTPGTITDSTANTKIISVTIADELSGIKTYRATLNNKWIAMEYDAKTGTLSYALKPQEAAAQKELLIEVTDAKGNKAVLKSVIE